MTARADPSMRVGFQSKPHEHLKGSRPPSGFDCCFGRLPDARRSSCHVHQRGSRFIRMICDCRRTPCARPRHVLRVGAGTESESCLSWSNLARGATRRRRGKRVGGFWTRLDSRLGDGRLDKACVPVVSPTRQRVDVSWRYVLLVCRNGAFCFVDGVVLLT